MPTKLEMLRKGAHVQRFHTWQSVTPNKSVGHHSHGVACLVQYLDPQCSKAILLAALHHDISEYLTGDIPSPAKWAHPPLKQAASEYSTQIEESYGLRHDLTPEEQSLLRWADMTDLVLFAFDEWYSGNQNYSLVARRGLAKLETWTPPNDAAAKLLANMMRTEMNFSRGDWTYSVYRAE